MIKTFADGAAFVAIDLEGAERSVGIVRQARKILQGGAEDLARSLTYTFASLELRQSGASAGVNADGDDRPTAIAAFVADIAPLVADNEFLPDPGKGVSPDDLAPLADHDPRSPLRHLDRDGVPFAAELAATSTAAAIERTLDGLDGQRVAIEGFEVNGTALTRELAAGGARITALSTAAGVVADPEGIDPDAIAAAWREHGPAMIGHLGPTPDHPIFAADVDILIPSSKMGCLTHREAETVRAGLVAPGAPLPVTARGLAVLRAADSLMLPDFVTQAGPVWAWEVAPNATPDDVRAAATDGVRAIIDDVLDHEAGAFLGACLRAEAFLSTWQDTLPFGRPLAA
ncbi:MAG: hypothetical protein OEW42_12690 [Acidimicrobiia bacterium]|nr:hypothetical protein [Acidimicrobiia bacterium]